MEFKVGNVVAVQPDLDLGSIFTGTIVEIDPDMNSCKVEDHFSKKSHWWYVDHLTLLYTSDEEADKHKQQLRDLTSISERVGKIMNTMFESGKRRAHDAIKTIFNLPQGELNKIFPDIDYDIFALDWIFDHTIDEIIDVADKYN